MNELLASTARIRTDVLFAIGMAIAAAVTAHVLLRKREVGSSVGWIGLAWFAPITGGLLYFIFGINRVQRRARKARPQRQRRNARGSWPSPGEDDHLDPLERGIGRITEAATEPGNTIQVYHDGDEAYPAMLDAIAGARSTVGMSSYIFDADEAGGRFIDALAAAQGRGVMVRVLVDGVGGGYILSPAYYRLRRAGVPAERFMRTVLPWRMPFLNLRNHKKILVVDGWVGFTGGMNISSDNVMASRPRTPVQDTHFRFEGPVVAQLTDNFAQDWSFATEEELEGEGWFPPIEPSGGASARVIDSGPDEDVEKIEFAVMQAVACARESIQVMTPYFLPDERLITALSLAAMRGVAVDLVLPQQSDHRFIDWATSANIGPLLKDGTRIWRCPPPFRHSKIMVVDGEWCLVGSSNWDMRSFRLNFELSMEIYSRDLAATLAALMDGNRGAPLTQADLDGRSTPVRLRDAAVRMMLPYL